MEKLREQGGEDLDISPDKYTFNTVIHAYAKSGAKEAATKAHRILDNMIQMYREGNSSVKPDTITVSGALFMCFSLPLLWDGNSYLLFHDSFICSTTLSSMPTPNQETKVQLSRLKTSFKACI